MSDDMPKRAKELLEEVVKDVESREKDVKKLKAMTKLAKDLGEDTSDLESMLTVVDDFTASVKRRLGKMKQ